MENETNKTATYGSMFSGVGGFDMGFDPYYECLWQIEWEKNCQQTLAYHWPNTDKYLDVCEVNGALLKPVDVITFGSPCQDLSVAGKRAGLEGSRSSMFFEATRIIKEMRDVTNGAFPRAVIWENVPGALTSNKGADFGAVLDTLAELGALAIEWAVLDARHFGVPQRRRRVFVVAIFDPLAAERCPTPLLPVIEGSRGDLAKGKSAGKGTAGSSADSTRGDRTNWAAGDDGTDTLRTAITSKWSKGSSGPSGDEAYNLIVESSSTPVSSDQQTLFEQPFVKSRRAQTTSDHETWVDGEVAPTLNAFDNGTESRATILVIDGTRVDDVRVSDDDISPTLCQRMGTGGNNVPMVSEPIVFQPGGMVRLGGHVWEGGPVPTLRAEAKRGDNEAWIAQPTYAFDTQFGSNANVFDDESPTLKASQQSPSVATAFSIREDAKAGNMSVTPTDTALSLTANRPSVQSHHAQLFISEQYAVRRLTVIECERLMGWPDNHTLYRADGKTNSDSTRYRMCGNGVATPVARWIAHHLNKIIN
jgi:DNA-cytosine methyltransferase